MYPGSSDEELFMSAKNYVIGLLQKISMYDFLPLLIGKETFLRIIGEYKAYDPSVNPNIANEFSTAAFRMGHSLILHKYPLINQYGEVERELRLHEMFFRPSFFNETMMEKLIRGTSETAKKPEVGG